MSIKSSPYTIFGTQGATSLTTGDGQHPLRRPRVSLSSLDQSAQACDGNYHRATSLRSPGRDLGPHILCESRVSRPVLPK